MESREKQNGNSSKMSKQSIQGEKNQNIKVYVRCRPVNDQERKARSAMCVDMVDSRRSVTVKSHHDKTFTFDGIFGKESSQIDIYRTVVQPLIAEVLQGYNCTVFAYGQTGTGKTYTMEGVRSEQLLSWQHDPHAGIVPRALHQIFSEVGDPGVTIIKVSFLELYNEELFDLLGSGDHTTKLKIFDDASAKGSVLVRGLEEVIVRDRQEVYALMERGASRRQVAATLMNASSSRSHTIFTITVISRDTTDNVEGLMRTGKLNLVDLAGSENIGRSGAQDKRAREAGNINQSLLTLGRVITALVERTPHVPYRESKLTRLLQDSLGGRTKTSIIATVSPAQVNIEETLSTLEYAFRAKNITNRPEVNQKLCKEVVLKHMTDELEQLRRDLRACREKNGFYIDETNYREMQSRLDLQSEELQKKAQEAIENAERIDLLKTQMNDINRLFEETQQELEKKTRQVHHVQSRLKEVNYNYTGAKILIKAHKITEEKLHEDATKMVHSLNMASTDANLLHDKVQRQNDVAHHNSTVLEKFIGFLSSRLDSSQRTVDDALSMLSSVNNLEKETILSLEKEGRLLKETDCAVAQIVREQEKRRAEFVANLTELERRAGEAMAALPKQKDKLASGIEDACNKIKEAIAENVVSEVRKLREMAENGLDDLVKTLNKCKLSAGALQETVSKEMFELDTRSAEMAKSTVEATTSSRKLIAERCDQMEELMREMDLLRSKMTSAVGDLRAVPFVQDEIGATAENISKEVSRRTRVVTEAVSTFVDTTSKGCDTAVKTTHPLKDTIASRESNLLKAANDYVVQHAADLKECTMQMCGAVSQTIEDVTNIKKMVVSESERIQTAAPSERQSMAALCKTVDEASGHIESTGQKLRELKADALNLLRENVKMCSPTGTTPMKRVYDAPRKVASTQPTDILMTRLQVRYEQASSEERHQLDEGHSILLDVSASPEMVALADWDKENAAGATE